MTPHHLHYVYVLFSERDRKLYIGLTSDLQRRLDEHHAGVSPSTKHRRPFRLVYVEGYASLHDARTRESRLKAFKRSYAELKKRLAHSLMLIGGGGG